MNNAGKWNKADPIPTNENMMVHCPSCGWTGKLREAHRPIDDVATCKSCDVPVVGLPSCNSVETAMLDANSAEKRERGRS